MRLDPYPEENAILVELAEYVPGLKKRSRKAITLALRQLRRFVREYPRKLRRILEIYGEQLHVAAKGDISYTEFLTRSETATQFATLPENGS